MTASASAAPRTASSGQGRVPTIIAASLARMLLFLEITVVGVALPAIQREFGSASDAAFWVVNGYLLAMTVLVVAGGRAGDRLGHRRIAIVGTGLFAAASVACALAPTLEVLVLARVVQGVGGALILPAAQALALAVTPPSAHGRAIGLLVAVSVMGMTAGPILGGVLVDGPGWRAVFALVAPVALGALLLFLRFTSETERNPAARVDPRSLLLFAGGMTAAVVAIMEVPSEGVRSLPVIGGLVVGAILLAAYVRVESTSTAPLLDLRLLRQRVFVGAGAAMAVYQWVLLGFSVFTLVQLQVGLGLEPRVAGLTFVPAVLPALLTALVGGRLVDRMGPRPPLLVGLGAMGAATLWLGLVQPADALTLLLPFLLFGTGVGLTVVSIQTAAMAPVPPESRGVAGGVLAAARQTGGVMGVAVTSVLFAAIESARLTAALAGLPATLTPVERSDLDGLLAGAPGARSALEALPPETARELLTIAGDAVGDAYRVAVLLMAALCALAIVAVRSLLPASDRAAPERRSQAAMALGE